MGKHNSIVGCITNHDGICVLIEVLCQPLVPASFLYAYEVRDYTTNFDEIEQDWGSVDDLLIDRQWF